MARTRLILAAMLIIAAAASADTVYMRDGKTHVGKTRRVGDNVLINLGHATITVAAEDVIHIEPGDVPKPQSSAAGTVSSSPASGAGGEFSIESATMPDPIVFMLMRSLETTPPGNLAEQLRRQIERWQIMAHERKRRSGGEWVAPADFARRRQAYNELLLEAQDHLKQVRTTSGRTQLTPAQEAENKRHESAAIVCLRRAALAWGDPLMRNFLCGAAEQLAGNHRAAEAFFRQCRTEAPHVAAFVQGHTESLLETQQTGLALEAAVQLVRLAPQSPQAVQLLSQAMRKSTGVEARSPTYAEAQKLLGRYVDLKRVIDRTFTRKEWLMPPKPWAADEGLLPAPPYDRLVLRQAMAVPIAPNALLVDAAAVADAAELFVRIDENTLLPATAARVSSSSRGSKLPPLAVIFVEDAEFTPVGLPDSPPAAADNVVFFGLSVYQPMGSRPREVAAKVTSASPELALDNRLAAGEAASPVLKDGALVGYLSGRTDPASNGGGPPAAIDLAELGELIKRSRKSTSSPYGYGRARRTPEPIKAEGCVFVVLATVGETLD